MKSHPALILTLPLLAALAHILTPSAYAHGTMISPKSRVKLVYEGLSQVPRPPWVVQAVAADGENSYYTWNQLSRNFIPAGDGNNIAPYTAAGGVPDGQLPSAGNNQQTKNLEGHPGLSFSGLDAVSNDWEWPTTQVTAGPMQCTFQATAAHDPSSFHVWITKSNYNHRVPLKWSDLEYLGKAAQTRNEMMYNLTVNLPARTGHHILYVGWQRIDPAGEVFFSTSDLQFGGGSNPGDPPVVSVSPAAMNVNENAGNAVVNVTLSSPAPSSGVTVNYTTANGTAGSTDFTAKSGALTFASGETQKQVSIPVANDTQQESDEVFSLNLSGPNGATAGTMTSTITIKDDDAPVSTGSGFTFNVYSNWGSGWRANLDARFLQKGVPFLESLIRGGYTPKSARP